MIDLGPGQAKSRNAVVQGNTENQGKWGKHSFRCEHKIFSKNLKRSPRCHKAAPRLYCGVKKTFQIHDIIQKICLHQYMFHYIIMLKKRGYFTLFMLFLLILSRLSSQCPSKEIQYGRIWLNLVWEKTYAPKVKYAPKTIKRSSIHIFKF